MLELQHLAGNRAVHDMIATSSRAADAGRPIGRSSSDRIQPKWQETDLNKDFYRWDAAVNGLRWYAAKEGDRMYFMVEQATETNRGLIPYQGRVKSHQQWLALGLTEMEDADPSVEGRHTVEKSPKSAKQYLTKDFGPFSFGVTEHRRRRSEGEAYSEQSEFVLEPGQKKAKGQSPLASPFAKATGAATPGKESPQSPWTIGIPANVDLYVFHLTTLRNLLAAPGSIDAGTGIRDRGLDPGMGGGPGGACETARVTNNKKMIEGSIKHSKAVVAVNTKASNLKMYANQRYDSNLARYAKGLYDDQDLIEREPILLRFKLKKEYISEMVPDPQHPKDPWVRLIKGTPIPPGEIEALISEGWKPVASLVNLEALMPELIPDLEQIYCEHCGARLEETSEGRPEPVCSHCGKAQT